MNPLKKGPEIKLSELRIPQAIVDLYYDLYDRHLLPVVGVLLIGIVAIPLFLGGSSDSGEPTTPTESGAVSPPAKTSSLVVAKEAPDLRDYKHRLKHLTAKDPFVQRYAGGDGSEGSTASASAPAATSPAAESPPAGSEPSPAPSPSGRSGGSSGGSSGGGAPSSGNGSGGGSGSGGSGPSKPRQAKPKVVYSSIAIDVRVTPVATAGKRSKAESAVRRDLPPLTMLPSREIPALTYTGPSRDGKKALMVVSSEVTSLFGDSACVIGSQSCQLLALQPGLPETVVWGPGERTFRVELLELHAVASQHPRRAPHGKPKPGKRRHGHQQNAG